jgi:hypothetical protein
MDSNRHVLVKKKTTFLSRTSRMDYRSLPPRSVNSLLAHYPGSVELNGISCCTGRDMECEGHGRYCIQSWSRDGTRECVLAHLRSS